MDLQNKIALVTGAAHRVGKGIALALAREGVHVVVHYGRSHEAAQQTKDEIESLGVEAFLFSADLGDPAQIEALFAAVRDRFGRLDILVNSAASFQRQPFDEITLEDWDRVMAVNLRAPFLCTQHAARLMGTVDRAPEEAALIVNISDLAGVYPWPHFVQHGVSKAGLLHLTKAAAVELVPHIRVNAILPGPILPPDGVDPAGERWQHITRGVPLQRSGDPINIGQTVVFFAQNDFITGAVVNVDGGEGIIGSSKYG